MSGKLWTPDLENPAPPPPFCVACAHFRSVSNKPAVCASPSVARAVDVVDGSIQPALCRTVRSDESSCGVAGQFFKAKGGLEGGKEE